MPVSCPGDAAPALRLPELMAVDDQTDTAGRLLLEDSAPRPATRAAATRGVLMRKSPCPYRDTPSRFGGQMNVSAYDALRVDTAGILDGFAWLRGELGNGQLLAPRPAAGSAQLLYQVSYLGVTLPLVVFHRAVDPVAPHGSLPTVASSIFKASRGLFSVAIAMLNEGAGPTVPILPGDVVRFADRHGHFVRPAPPRVCAAPTRLIERTVSVILSGQGGSPPASQLAGLVAFPMLWQFYRVQDELSQALSTYSFVLGRLSQRAGPSAPGELLHLPVPGTSGTFGQLTDAMLAHVNSAQVELNRILGRVGAVAPLGFPQLLDLL